MTIEPSNTNKEAGDKIGEHHCAEKDSCEYVTEKKPYLKLNFLFKRIPSIINWTICSGILMFFGRQIFDEYKRRIPITTTTFLDPPELPDPVRVKICNNVFLDPRKILQYNGTDVSPNQHNFLLQAVKGNNSFDDSLYVSQDQIKQEFLLSQSAFNEFKLDKEDFIVQCRLPYYEEDCLSTLKWHVETSGVCYQGDIQLYGYGTYELVTILFYFDPAITLERYTRGRLGAYVSITHPEDSLSYSNTFFLNPNDLAVISAKTVHKNQEDSFDDSKCEHRYGLETWDFTGVPFQALYKTDSCIDLCYAKSFFSKCQCAATSAWNMTKTECLEDISKLTCIFMIHWNWSRMAELERLTKPCISNCLVKCKEKNLETQLSKVQLNYVGGTLLPKLQILAWVSSNESLANKLLAKIENSSNHEHMVQNISANMAEVKFYMQLGQRVKKLETILLMSKSTLISNIGGLIGMWLGLSAMSILEFLKKGCAHFLFAKHRKNIEPQLN